MVELASPLRFARPAAVASVALVATVVAATGTGATGRGLAGATCDQGYVQASLSWGVKCLRVGEFCKVGNVEYHAYGLDCPPSGLLTSYRAGTPGASTGSSTPLAVGATVLPAP